MVFVGLDNRLLIAPTEEAKDENGFGFRGVDQVVVDLNFPDNILIETFKQYLAARRAESKTEHFQNPIASKITTIGPSIVFFLAKIKISLHKSTKRLA